MSLENKPPKHPKGEQNKLLVAVTFREVEESVISNYVYQPITKVKAYNSIRKKIFDLLKEQFIDPVISKGLKNEHHKILLQNNYDEFLRFLEREIRYWLAFFLNSQSLRGVIMRYNHQLIEELNYNYLTTRGKMAHIDIQKLTTISNAYIERANITTLPKKISEYILSKNSYKEKILSFFNKFLKYLIIF